MLISMEAVVSVDIYGVAMPIYISTCSLSSATTSYILCCRRTELQRQSVVSIEQFSFHKAWGALLQTAESGLQNCYWKPMHLSTLNSIVGHGIGGLIGKRNQEHGVRRAVDTVCKEGKAMETQSRTVADYDTYARLLQKCIDLKSLAEGKRAHLHMMDTGFDIDVYIGNLLISMYAKCSSMKDARQVFDKMSQRDVVSWNAIIAGFVQNGLAKEALKFFKQMGEDGMKPNKFTYISLLRACAALEEIEHGKHVHNHILKAGFMLDVSVRNALVTMYAKCGSTDDANIVFVRCKRNVVSWNAMIAGYMQNGQGKEALKLFCEMRLVGIKPDLYTYVTTLSSCVGLEGLEHGEQVYAQIIKTEFGENLAVGNVLITLHAKHKNVVNARKVFDRMPIRDMVSWNAMIAGYAQNGHGDEVLQLIRQMQSAGMKLAFMLNQFTFASILRVCASLIIVKCGKEVHARIIKTGFEKDVFVGSALVDMYSKCGSIEDACRMFNEMPAQNLISWNAMIAGYAQNGYAEEALKYFIHMELQGMKPNQFTFTSVLKACATLTALEYGRGVHAHILKTGVQCDVFVGSALIDMYTKCESIEVAAKIFESMPERNLVSWNAMIAGYVQNGHNEGALKIFCQMRHACIMADHFNLASILGACAGLAAFGHGQQVHALIIKTGFDTDDWVESALVDMYGKCGDMESAREVFDETVQRDVVLWTVMIAAYAQHGYGKEALRLFEEMQSTGMKPDHITFVGVLSACSQEGLVNKGREYFHSMSQYYGIMPRVEHYACMVDLLGRAGCLDEAENFIKEMPLECGSMVWQTLLVACRVHNNMELGKHVAENILEMEPEDSTIYGILSTIYTAAGRWEDVAKVQELMKDRGVKMEPGQSWIEIKSRVHKFVARDRSHPHMEEIYARLEELTRQMKEAGYIPNTYFLMHEVEDEQNGWDFCYHS